MYVFPREVFFLLILVEFMRGDPIFDDQQEHDSFWVLSENEKERIVKLSKKKSLRRWCYHYSQQNDTFPRPLAIAGLGDMFKEEARALAIYETAKILGYEVAEKDKLTDYRRRKTLKIKIGKTALYFIPNKQRSQE